MGMIKVSDEEMVTRCEAVGITFLYRSDNPTTDAVVRCACGMRMRRRVTAISQSAKRGLRLRCVVCNKR